MLSYIDPASTSSLLYFVVVLVVGAAYSLTGYFYKIKGFIQGRGFSSAESFEGVDIAFYSEGGQYWNVFLPVIEALETQGVSCAYLTSAKNDPGLEYESEFVSPRYIGGLAQTAVYLSHLKVKLLATTTPQIDVLNLKRSPDIAHYAHIIHSPVDVHNYRFFPFDYFDSVLCSGPHQVRSIRYLEQERGTKPKDLYETGLTYYDLLLKNRMNIQTERPTVLVAPTWKPHSLLNRFGNQFFRNLLENPSYDVIFRPHPQSFVSFPKLVEDVVSEFSDNPRFRLDSNHSGAESMATADLMISDASGVIFDFAFVYSKPVITIETDLNFQGFEAMNLPHEMWDAAAAKEIGIVVKEADVDQIAEKVAEVLDNPSQASIDAIAKSSVYNLGSAGKACGKVLTDISETL